RPRWLDVCDLDPGGVALLPYKKYHPAGVKALTWVALRGRRFACPRLLLCQASRPEERRGRDMVERTAKQGASAGSRFWGVRDTRIAAGRGRHEAATCLITAIN